MPRREGSYSAEVVRLPQPPAVAPKAGVVASARRLSGSAANRATKRGMKKISQKPWQDQCWHFFDTVGEYHYLVKWVGSLMSRGELKVMKGDEEVTEGPAFDAMSTFFGGREGQAEFLRRTGMHLTVAGEAYAVGRSKMEEEDDWTVVAPKNIDYSLTGSGFRLKTEEIGDALVVRIWQSHPLDDEESDSPSRAVIPTLRELMRLTMHVAAQIDSRLLNAGILLLPSEMDFPGRDADGNGIETIDDLVAEFEEIAAIAIEDHSSPEATVPMVLQAPGEHLDKVRLLRFSSELDAKAKELRDEAIQRLALGMDAPPEALTGAGDMNHWSSWQSEESQIKAHTEPLLNTIAAAVTKGYLQPAIKDVVADWAEYRVVGDSTKIRVRPNRAKEAVEMYDRGELSAAAMLRENGFDIRDKMSARERRDWIVKNVAQGSTTPELVAAAIAELGVALDLGELEATPTEAPQARSLEEHPVRELPNTQDVEAAAAEVVVFRALERCGNRLKRIRTPRGSSAMAAFAGMESDRIHLATTLTEEEIDDVLMGSFTTLSRLSTITDPVEMESKLSAYVRYLLLNRVPHDFRLMRTFL